MITPSTQSQPSDRQSPIPVRCLLGHRHIGLACACLGSLLRHCKDSVRFILHDDGSLEDDDLAKLRAELANPEFVNRKDADQRMNAELSRYPHTRQWRGSNDPLALKSLDFIYYERDPVVTQVDSDIFFLRSCQGLFILPDDIDGIFLTDSESSYSLRSWNLLLPPGMKLADRVNSGIVCLRKSGYDPELVEWFLSRPIYRKLPYYVEQTIWALLAQRIRSRQVDSRQIAIIRPGLPVDDDLVAVHFVSKYRGLLSDYENHEVAGASENSTAKIRLLRTRPCTIYRQAATEARRVAGRLRARFS